MELAGESSPCASIPEGRPSQQISSENGRSGAGMKPAGMSARSAKAASNVLASHWRLLRSDRSNQVSLDVRAAAGAKPSSSAARVY